MARDFKAAGTYELRKSEAACEALIAVDIRVA